MDISPLKKTLAIIGFFILIIVGGEILFGKGKPIHPLIQKITQQ